MNEHFTRAPHRSSTSQPGAGPHAALMIDFDNVTMGIRSNLGQELRSLLESDIIRGKVSVQRAYADWRRYPQYIVPLSEASIDLIFAPAYGSTKKNATDIRLAIDALELVFTRPEIGTFILLSGDSDFSSLVLKLKEYGKYIIGVGLQESSSDLLVQNCDEYYSYNSLSGLTSAEDMETVRHDPWELAEKAVRRMKERNDVMRSDRLKQVMLELDQSFDEKELGFSKFNRFLAEASSRGLIRLHRIENGQYEVDLGKSARETSTPSEPSAPQRQAASPKPSTSAPRKPAPSKEPAPKKPARSDAGSASDGAPPSGVPTEAASLRKAYHLLSTVVGELSEAGEPVRDSEVKREMLRRDQGFDEAEYGFRKFSRFLRQAHDEEVVDLTTDDNGNYHLGPAGSTSAKAPSSDGAGRAPSGAPAKKKRERKPEPSRPERQPESRAQEAPQPEPQPTSKPQTAPETKDSDGDDPSASDRESEEPAEKRPARRGVGRFGRRSRPSTGGDDGGGLPGPVGAVGPVDDGSSGSADSPGPSESGAGARTRSDATTRTGSGTKSSGGRKGLGRYRRGSRKGGSGGKGPSLPDVGPVGGSEPGDDAGRDGATEDEAPEGGHDPGTGPAARAPGGDVSAGADGTSENRGGDRGGDRVAAMDGPSGEVVEHMIRNYAGVGRKTAEKLLEEFGEDVFRVIDEQPERLSRVLPQHRAQAVVEAREAEREQRAT